MTRTVVVGGTPGWQIVMIVAGAALLSATLAGLADRARAAHGRMPAIQRCDDDRRMPPGRVPELGETSEDGVARDLLEQAGIRLRAERLTGVCKNMRLGVLVLAFRCRVIGGQQHATNEARQVARLTVGETRNEMAEAGAVPVIDALSSSGPAVGVHDGTCLTPLDGWELHTPELPNGIICAPLTGLPVANGLQT